nr:heavy metal translocating P-type ATPase [Prevotella sp. UBA5379]
MDEQKSSDQRSAWVRLAFSSVMLIAGLVLSVSHVAWIQIPYLRLVWYIIAFLPVGLPVMKEAVESIMHGDYSSEFMLMSIAAIGAFAISEYPEAVAVMLLYSIGEELQDRAVDKAKDNIKSLVAFRPDHARVLREGKSMEMNPEQVLVGDIIEVRPGERVPLDGVLLDTTAAFNTAALTGESVPRLIQDGKEVFAGMIASYTVVRLRVIRPAEESAISRVLKMVEDATERKAPTELFIHKFAHIYTPVVMGLALLTLLLPWVISGISPSFHYIFSDWFRRSLIFLVISCPCALVISIPLGYFAGIGAASKRGILFKGSNYVDAITKINTVVFDKTGTMTTGQFAVQKSVGLQPDDLDQIAAMEKTSSHPIALAILRYHPVMTTMDAKNLAGYGLVYQGWLVGNTQLLDHYHISYPEELRSVPETIVVVAHGRQYKGYLLLADTLKEDAAEAVAGLHSEGVRDVEMLSGDKQALVTKVAGQLKMTGGYGDLLPEGKVAHISALQQQGRKVAFIGDGINDAPVIALSDVGLAMGALGSDMAIETADVVIQDDRPSKVAEAIHIGRRTHHIVYENIVLAIGIKVLVMILGLFGVANLWEAVFADSGVALLAVINATRIFFDREYKYSARVVNILQDKEQLEHFKESGSDFHEQVNL